MSESEMWQAERKGVRQVGRYPGGLFGEGAGCREGGEAA